MPRKKRPPTHGEQVVDMVFPPGSEERDRLTKWHIHMLIRQIDARVDGARSGEQHRCFEILRSATAQVFKV